jgi:hypothetical protein
MERKRDREREMERKIERKRLMERKRVISMHCSTTPTVVSVTGNQRNRNTRKQKIC